MPPASPAPHSPPHSRATVALIAISLVSAYVLFAPDPAGAGLGPPGADKVVHLTLFALLAAATRWRFGAVGWAVVAVAAYAALSEVVQALFLVHRSGDVRDVVADLLGAALGWWYAGRLTAPALRAPAGRPRSGS